MYQTAFKGFKRKSQKVKFLNFNLNYVIILTNLDFGFQTFHNEIR